MKKLIIICLLITTMFIFTGCQSVQHDAKDFQAGTVGLDRHVKVMTADGKVIAEFDGLIDIKSDSNGVVFEYEGKRYAYYNCFVEAIEK